MATRESTRPIVSLMTHVASDLAYLVQTEFRLARAEISEKLSDASNAGVYLALGGVVALGGFIALLFDIANWITVAGLPYRMESADRGLGRAGDRRRSGDGRRQPAERIGVRSEPHARADAGRLCGGKGARAMTSLHDRSQDRLSTSRDYEQEAERHPPPPRRASR